MEYVNLSNINERVIKFGLSVPERYKNISISDIEEFDPWWNVHLIVVVNIKYNIILKTGNMSCVVYINLYILKFSISVFICLSRQKNTKCPIYRNQILHQKCKLSFIQKIQEPLCI